MIDFIASSLRNLVGNMVPAPTEEAPQKGGLFGQCFFVIIQGPKLNSDEAAKLQQVIKLHNGETRVKGDDHAFISLEGITHVISYTIDFPEYDAACDALTPVVKPSWVDASLAKDKLAQTRQFSPDPRLFMTDVVVCCADLPGGDAEAIAGGVLAMGGLYANKVTSQVTHVVALTMESDQCALVQSRKLNVKIVLPHWFDDCLKLGRRIDEQPYLLPDPDILRHPNTNPPLAADNGNVRGATHPDPSAYPSPSSSAPRSPRGKLRVFTEKTVMLGSDLGIGSHLRTILEDLIIEGGGKLALSARKADMYICKFREGHEYKVASISGKDVGNLAWLYYLIMNNTWTSPMRRLLHYPTARQGLPGFKNLKISLSNYSGEARTYLENLVNAAGAECTKTLKQDNTHLITAHIQSEKCAAAKDWGIHLVNHLWLEESYARWRIQSVTDTRYTHFPRRTNLGEVVGQTRLDRTALESNFFPDEDTEMEDATDMPKAMQTKAQTLVSELIPASNKRHSPGLPSVNSRAAGKSRSLKDEQPLGEQEKVRTPAVSRFVSLGKENETPTTTGSRKSKDAAALRLHDMTSDIALYEKERKRVGGVVYGGRRKNDKERALLVRKRSHDESSDSEASDEKEAKKSKPASSKPAMHILISGYKKWVAHPKVEDLDKKQLRSLGIVVTADPARASYLAAPNILRTLKFVAAIAFAPKIISTQFIDDCLERDEHLDPESYVLHDKVNEKKLGFTLALARKRASENRQQLFQGRTIYCVENIYGGFETFKTIVEVNGGQCNQYRGRPGTMVPSKRADSEGNMTDEDTQNEVYLLSGDDKEVAKVWNRFRQMAESSRKIPRIVKTDWLLESAMSQAVLPIGKYELS